MTNSTVHELELISLSIDQQKIGAYAEITHDWNPLHLNEEFASSTNMGGVVAHGTLSLNLVLQSLAATLGSDALQRTTLDVRFLKPVRPGDRVQAGGRWSVEGNRWDVWVNTDSGETVISGTATVD